MKRIEHHRGDSFLGQINIRLRDGRRLFEIDTFATDLKLSDTVINL
jgi:hypothetical protein